jgi:hypothetical protein
LGLVATTQAPLQLRQAVQVLCDQIVIDHSDELSENEVIVRRIFEVYFQLAIQCFHEQDPFDLSEHNVFSCICVEFSEFPPVLDFLCSLVPTLLGDPAGRYAATVALLYTFKNTDSYADKVETVAGWLVDGIRATAPCLREAAVTAIAELALYEHSVIGEVAEDLLGALMEALSDPIPEVFKAIAALIPITDSGQLYDQIYAGLAPFLRPQPGPILLALLNCLLELLKKAPGVARRNFGTIFGVAQAVIHVPGDEADMFHPTAIAIIATLFDAAPRAAARAVPAFLSDAVSALSAPDDAIAYEAIRAVGHLAVSFESLVAPAAPDILSRLLSLASRPLADLPSDDSAFLDDETPSVSEARIVTTTTALRIACCVLAHAPHLLPTYLADVLAIAGSQLSSGVSDCARAVCGGASFLVEALSGFGLTDETRPFIGQLASVLADVVASETSLNDGAGAGFTALSDIIAAFGEPGVSAIGPALGRALDAAGAIFRGEMVYQGGKLVYDEALLPAAQRFLRELMAALGGGALPLVGPFTSTLHGLVHRKKAAMRDLALQFLGDLVFWCGEVDGGIKENVCALALQSAGKGSSIAFGCIAQLAEKAPEVLINELPRILELIRANLTSIQKKSEAIMTIQDNCVSALGKIAENILKDSFPFEQLLLPALAAMPAQMEVEENKAGLAFFKWLLARANGNCVEQFAAVLVRLFSDGLDKMSELYVSEGDVAELRQVLRGLLARIQDPEGFCREECQGDDFKLENVREALAES